jgi:hypothetical protein
MGWTTEGSEFESKQGQEFSLLHIVQTSSRTHPTSYPMVHGSLSLGSKQPGCEVDHSPPTGAKVKKKWIYTYVFMAQCLVKHNQFIIHITSNSSVNLTNFIIYTNLVPVKIQ